MTLLFDNPAKISDVDDFSAYDYARTLKRASRTEVKANQADRLRALEAEGNIVRVGATGTTVFHPRNHTGTWRFEMYKLPHGRNVAPNDHG